GQAPGVSAGRRRAGVREALRHAERGRPDAEKLSRAVSSNPEIRTAAPRFDLAGRPPSEIEAAWRRFGAAASPEEFCQSWLELQWGAAWLEVLLRRAADPLEAARLRLNTMLQLLAVFLEHERFRDAAAALVTELASRLGCDRVVLASLERGVVHIEAVSNTAQFDRHANLLVATLNAMSEAL